MIGVMDVNQIKSIIKLRSCSRQLVECLVPLIMSICKNYLSKKVNILLGHACIEFQAYGGALCLLHWCLVLWQLHVDLLNQSECVKEIFGHYGCHHIHPQSCNACVVQTDWRYFDFIALMQCSTWLENHKHLSTYR